MCGVECAGTVVGWVETFDNRTHRDSALEMRVTSTNVGDPASR
jgi:hypothetical protein